MRHLVQDLDVGRVAVQRGLDLFRRRPVQHVRQHPRRRTKARYFGRGRVDALRGRRTHERRPVAVEDRAAMGRKVDLREALLVASQSERRALANLNDVEPHRHVERECEEDVEQDLRTSRLRALRRAVRAAHGYFSQLRIAGPPGLGAAATGCGISANVSDSCMPSRAASNESRSRDSRRAI